MNRALPYPRATYRIQLSADFTFRDAAAVIPYLDQLGFSHIYASPILAARAGSSHGYDIVDHNRINPEIGGEDGFTALVEALHAHDMGLVVDFVPNHMGVGYSDNVWWLNLLEWGRRSPYASFFDIDWKPSEQTLRGKVLIPILGSQYGTALEEGDLKLLFDRTSGSFSVRYFEHRFPVSPVHYSTILRDLPRDLSPEIPELAKAFRDLGTGSRSASRMAITIRRAGELRGSLSRLAESRPAVADAIERVCREWNGTPGDRRSFDRLHALLERQAYRLAYWRLAANEINYRRFFDINDLAAVRMELPEVFEITHQLILRLIQEGKIQGLRLDHVDGLLDPRAYLERLQEAAAYRMLGRPQQDLPEYRAALDQPIYVLVEKILAHHEELRRKWQVSGTTGYDHMSLVGELLTDPAGEEPLTEIYQEFVGAPRDFPGLVLHAKYRTMQDTLASELNVLANRLSRLAKGNRRTRDLSRLALRSALMDIVARFPVYRSYADHEGVTEQDRRDIEWAVATARKAARTVDTSAYDFIRSVLTTDLVREYPGEFRRRAVVELAMKVQQFTAPVMAKSFEDTAFYRDARFIARNEVGSEPDRFFTSPQAFHYANRDRRQNWPFAMVATATHDHKRGEDTRARLYVISEVPHRWSDWVLRLAEFTTGITGEQSPSPNDQYFLLQTLAGTWPLELRGPDYEGMQEYSRRIVAYSRKAAREAKLETSWTAPDEEYEATLERYITGILNPRRSPTVLRHMEEFVRSIQLPGVVNSLSQKALTLTVPGVPDIYQGAMGWDFSLVDPDNRNAVDYSAHREILDRIELTPSGCRRALDEWIRATPKHLVTAAILDARKKNPDLFARGDYLPLETAGEQAERIIAFVRTDDAQGMVVIAPRLTEPLLRDATIPLPVGWGDTAVAIDPMFRRGRNLFTGETVHCSDGTLQAATALEHFPVAVVLFEIE
ncbi:MAG: malto-oligosyltrehalose synthase [Spirochaetaceae bacterium]|nr:MAG: malto-oligosyltrehalose synthase [Spirochaetaceae bacterium]